MKTDPLFGQILQELYVSLNSSEEGLTEDAAALKLLQVGPNEVGQKKEPHPFLIFLKQFKSPLIFILLGMSLISFFLHKKADPWVILGVALFNAFMGFYQEKKAKTSLDALKKQQKVFSKVYRDKIWHSISAEQIVPGDILELTAGEQVMADCVIVKGSYLSVEESFLTGESCAQTKTVAHTIGENQLLYRGSLILKGKAEVLVVRTGKQTEIGQIESLLDEELIGESPLEKRLRHLSHWLGALALGSALLLIAIGFYKHLPPTELFLLAASQIVSVIPEGLPIAVTIVLALGIRRMSEKNVIIRKLHAAETLGSTTLIACDKTGTLTENKMILHGFYPKGSSHPASLNETQLQALILCNDSRPSGDKFEGDPTENALLKWALSESQFTFDALNQQYPRIDELPFDPETRLSATLNKDYGLIVKGALEALLPLTDLDEGQKEHILLEAKRLQEEGFRILGYATKTDNPTIQSLKNLNYLGFGALIDPPRKEAAKTLAWCAMQNIDVVMITGDHPSTAYGIAHALGLAATRSQVILAKELLEKSDEEFKTLSPTIKAIARALPQDKYELIKRYKQSGHVVAMTGDGINDAPSLKLADIGVAMGKEGTSLAAYASSMIIADDKIETLIDGVKEGKQIQTLLYHLVDYLITTSLSSIFVLLPCLLLDRPFPFTPLQLLWINVVTEGCITTTMVLSDLKKHKNVHIFRLNKQGLKSAFSIPLLGLFLLAYDLYHPISPTLPTEVFTLFAFIGLLKSLFVIDRFSKSWALIGGIAMGFFLQLVILYVPALQKVFQTTPLSGMILLKLLGFSLIFCALFDLLKKILRDD